MEVAKLVLEYIKVLIWPLSVVLIVLIFRKQLSALMNRIRHAELPGGMSLDLDQEIKEARFLSTKLQESTGAKDAPGLLSEKRSPPLQLTEANARMINLGLRPSPSGLDMRYYRQWLDQDPNIALAGLRIELDILIGNLAKGFHIPVDRNISGHSLIRLLYEENAITKDQMSLFQKVYRVCSAAVHGTPVSRDEADDVIGSAEVLGAQYLNWLAQQTVDERVQNSEEPAGWSSKDP
jgi:hypothetical protein